ncbi:MAG: hypothetical protein RIR51_1459 [Bacteroidota bacterium]|jgi:hypothetical protein
MKLKNIFIILLSLVVFSCDNFVEMNTNPNEPTKVTPDVLLPSAIRKSVTSMVTESFLIGNNAAQITSKTLRTEVDTYKWNAFPTVWESMYGSLTDLYLLEKLAGEQNNSALKGAAITMKAWIYSVLTNAYGDIPYSQAINGNKSNFTPNYDLQEDIYADLLTQLSTASTLLSSGGSISGDILYGGDVSKWKKLANSLKLRLLMTANNQLANAGSEFSTIISSGDYMKNNEDNAELIYLESFPNQFPLIPLKTGDFDAVALSSNALASMLSKKDPRLLRFARPDNDDYINPIFSGAINGSNSGNCSKVGSRLGAAYYNYPGQTQANDLGLSNANGIIMTYSEVEFLIAEAAAKGWINENIEVHYKNGIKASQDYYQVDYSTFGWENFDDFYSNSGIAFSKTIDIWEQKWLSLFFTGLEPYFEVRRWYFESGSKWGNIPFLSAPCENLNGDKLPNRFLYPGEEQSLNSENYKNAIQNLGGTDDINASIWLVK